MPVNTVNDASKRHQHCSKVAYARVGTAHARVAQMQDHFEAYDVFEQCKSEATTWPACRKIFSEQMPSKGYLCVALTNHTHVLPPTQGSSSIEPDVHQTILAGSCHDVMTT